METPSEDAVRARAYQIWQDEGEPPGKALEHWDRAERELQAGGEGQVPPTSGGAPAGDGQQPAAGLKPSGTAGRTGSTGP